MRTHRDQLTVFAGLSLTKGAARALREYFPEKVKTKTVYYAILNYRPILAGPLTVHIPEIRKELKRLGYPMYSYLPRWMEADALASEDAP
jgi:hypothetical protein